MVTAMWDKSGVLLLNEDEILDRWKKHLDEVPIVDLVGADMPDGNGAVSD